MAEVRGHTSAKEERPNVMNHKVVGKGPLIDVSINGVQVRALLDSGGTASSISPRLVYGELKDTRMKKRNCRLNVKVADGGLLAVNEVIKYFC